MLERQYFYDTDAIHNLANKKISYDHTPIKKEGSFLHPFIFHPFITYFKANSIELARKFWGLSDFDKLEFTVQLSRMVDRIFMERSLPYKASIRIIKHGSGILDRYETVHFNQRTISFKKTMSEIYNLKSTYLDSFDFYFIITPINFNLNLDDSDTNVIYIINVGESKEDYNEDNNVNDDEIINLELNLKEENRVLYYYRKMQNIDFDQVDFLTIDMFNTLFPIIDDALTNLVHLRLELPYFGQDMLALALTNSFQEYPLVRNRETYEANKRNRIDENSKLAIEALAIFGANQFGQQYYSGRNDPRQILQELKRKYERIYN